MNTEKRNSDSDIVDGAWDGLNLSLKMLGAVFLVCATAVGGSKLGDELFHEEIVDTSEAQISCELH